MNNLITVGKDKAAGNLIFSIFDKYNGCNQQYKLLMIRETNIILQIYFRADFENIHVNNCIEELKYNNFSILEEKDVLNLSYQPNWSNRY